MQSLIGSALVVLALMVASGILTMAEIALGSAQVPVEGPGEPGRSGCRGGAPARRDPKRFSPTVQAGITLLGALAGVYGGAARSPSWAGSSTPTARSPRTATRSRSAWSRWGSPWRRSSWVSSCPGVALQWPERIAGLVARPIGAMAMVAGPLVGALSTATDLALRTVGLRPKHEPPVTEEAIQVLMRQGTQAGVFELAEQEMVKRVLRFGDRRARSLMTPRNEVVWIDAADSPEEIRRKVVDSPHSRFPVCDQSLDNLLGIVHVKEPVVLLVEAGTAADVGETIVSVTVLPVPPPVISSATIAPATAPAITGMLFIRRVMTLKLSCRNC